MKLAEGIEALELPGDVAGRPRTLYPALFTDREGATLVDTGMPGRLPALVAAIEAAGVRRRRCEGSSSPTRISITSATPASCRKAFAVAEVLAHEANPLHSGREAIDQVQPVSVWRRCWPPCRRLHREQARALFSSPSLRPCGSAPARRRRDPHRRGGPSRQHAGSHAGAHQPVRPRRASPDRRRRHARGRWAAPRPQRGEHAGHGTGAAFRPQDRGASRWNWLSATTAGLSGRGRRRLSRDSRRIAPFGARVRESFFDEPV